MERTEDPLTTALAAALAIRMHVSIRVVWICDVIDFSKEEIANHAMSKCALGSGEKKKKVSRRCKFRLYR